MFSSFHIYIRIIIMIQTQSQNEEIRQIEYKVGHEIWWKFKFEVGCEVIRRKFQWKVGWKVGLKVIYMVWEN